MKKNNPLAILQAAATAHERKNHEVAIKLYNAVLALDPNQPMALHNLSNIHLERTQLDEAEALLLRLFAATGYGDVGAMNTLATVYLKQRRITDSIALLHQAREVDPAYPETYVNLSAAYLNDGQADAALNYAFEALKLDITNKYAFNNLGSAYGNLAMFDEARIAFETAIELDPDFFEAILNFGSLEARKSNHEKAIEIYAVALNRLSKALASQADVIRYYLAFSQLSIGQLKEGWQNYEGGFHPNILKRNARAPNRKFKVPKWKGESLTTKKLLIWREQGLGDEIQFMSCLADMKELLPRIIIECDRRMVDTFQRAFPQAHVREQLADLTLNAIHTDYDYHLPVGSLMGFTRNQIEDFKRAGAYLVPDPVKLEHYKAWLAERSDGKTVVGICWRSGMVDALRNLHYLPLDSWKPIFDLEKVTFVNLQYGECEAEIAQAEEKFGIKILRPDMNLKDDLDDVLSLIATLDYVVSAGTAVAIIGGAVGTKTLRFGLEGNWTKLGTDHFPWFPDLIPFDEPAEALPQALVRIADYLSAAH